MTFGRDGIQHVMPGPQAKDRLRTRSASLYSQVSRRLANCFFGKRKPMANFPQLLYSPDFLLRTASTSGNLEKDQLVPSLILRPPVERLEQGYPFFCSLF